MNELAVQGISPLVVVTFFKLDFIETYGARDTENGDVGKISSRFVVR